ncbi:MAG: MarR family transcriptional regulator [Silicimonas sp.]|jgi:DNA-binding MarR family transcriptional regulator|nr:MarR family transcriptional regulator [Silicimonas sp.]
MPTEDFHLSDFLPYRLAVLAERVSRRLAAEYGKTHGLTVAEWRVIAHLSQNGAVSVRDIQRNVNLEKPRVSRAVARLEATGLVRKVPGKTDARLVSISLTKKGEQALTEILPAARTVEDQLLAAAGSKDLKAFFKVIDSMHAVLDADAKPNERKRDA